MLRNKNILLLIFLLFSITGCIEPYMPRITDEAGNIYVIFGEVTDQEGYQFVTVAMASPINSPENIPVSRCIIEIQDDKDHVFAGEEFETGRYRVWMDKEFLITGTSYRIQIKTPSGEEILSGYDRLPDCPEVDSVYYERKELLTNNPGQNIIGLQFYIDLEGKTVSSRYYRWNIEETWEYHAPYPLENYYDGEIRRVVPADYTNKICWSTEKVSSIYTLSTQNLITNSYRKLPLHFVDNSTIKLYFGYSVRVYQYAITESAYIFWEQLRINSEEQGGLYEQQPLPVEGNLQNVSHPDHKVLGYFGASSVTMKRIFVEGIRDMDIFYDAVCSPLPLDRMGWRGYEPSDYPVYFVYIKGKVMTIDERCINCRVYGGTNVKPDFWKW
jgi:hypothetical protein